MVEEEGGGVFSMSSFSFYQFFFSLFFFSIFPFCFFWPGRSLQSFAAACKSKRGDRQLAVKIFFVLCFIMVR